MRRQVLVSALLAVVLAGPSTSRADDSTPEWLAKSRVLATQLMTELKAELGRALSSSGPAAAIEVCRVRAPEIAARLSKESGATVSRTALRVRNPANTPDDLQRAVLEQFATDLASGKVPMPLEAAVDINRGGSIEHRYMRAIPMDALCTTCHGKTLAPDVAAAIAKAYPQDAATGFEPGQLRGAVSVIWPAPPAAANP